MLGLQTGMPSIKVVPDGDGSRVAYAQVQQAFGKGAPGALQVVAPRADAARVAAMAKADPGVAQVMRADARSRRPTCSCRSCPSDDPSDKAVGATIDRLRSALPAAALGRRRGRREPRPRRPR